MPVKKALKALIPGLLGSIAACGIAWAAATWSIGTVNSVLGQIILYGNTSGSVTVQPLAVAGSSTMFVLPGNNGTSGQFLQTDGSGNTSWQTASGTGNTTSTSLTTNTIPKANGANSIINSSLTDDGTTVTSTEPTVISGTTFSLSGAQTANTWGTNGIRYKNIAAILTDNSASGTVATAYTDVFGGNTIAATNTGRIFTNYYSAYFKAPVQGTNVTFTNNFALGADSLNVANSATFAEAHGTAYQISFTSGSNYNAVVTDCGKTLLLPTGTSPTLTLPNINPTSGECSIKVVQMTSAQYTIQAASGGTLVSVNSYTKTKGQYAVLILTLIVPSASAATWDLSGDGA